MHGHIKLWTKNSAQNVPVNCMKFITSIKIKRNSNISKSILCFEFSIKQSICYFIDTSVLTTVMSGTFFKFRFIYKRHFDHLHGSIYWAKTNRDEFWFRTNVTHTWKNGSSVLMTELSHQRCTLDQHPKCLQHDDLTLTFFALSSILIVLLPVPGSISSTVSVLADCKVLQSNWCQKSPKILWSWKTKDHKLPLNPKAKGFLRMCLPSIWLNCMVWVFLCPSFPCLGCLPLFFI